MDCAKCLLVLPSDGDYAVCGKRGCAKAYHFDCTTVSGSSWRSMGPDGSDRKKEWRWVPCKEEKQKQYEATKSQQAAKINKDKDKEQSKQGVSISDQGDIMGELGKLSTTMNELQKTLSDEMGKSFASFDKKIDSKFSEFEKALSFYGDKVDDANNTVKELEKKLVLMEKRLDKSEAENMELKTKIRKMEKQWNDMDQREYSTKIEISGIKDRNIDENEVTKKILQKVSDSNEDIQFKAEKLVMKIGENKTEKISIVFQLRSREVRNEVLTKIRERKVYSKMNEIIPDNGTPVFFNEQLCPQYRKLFFEANRIKREKGYAFLWVKDGRILLKKEANGNTLRLESMDDLAKM